MPSRTPSSIVYGTLAGALAWARSRDCRILRAAYLLALAACLWANRIGLACTLLVLGQFGQEFKDVFRGKDS